jgi:WD40 repeat protein
VFSPARSLIRSLFKDEEPKWITIKPAMGDKWSACLQTLEGHSGSVNSVAFSHDSARLASASRDSTVKIWDASSGKCLQTLKGHNYSVDSVAFSHDSARLASASGDNTVKIWDASSGKCLQTLEIGRRLFNISFDTTGLYLRTEIGIITIDAPSALNITPSVTDPQKPLYQGGALSLDRAWITYNSENIVWLPSEYRPSCSAVSGKTIGVGVGSGKIWICNFKVDNA